MEQVAERVCKTAPTLSVTLARIGNVAGADALLGSAMTHATKGTAVPLHRFGAGELPRYPVRSYLGPRDLFACIRCLCAQPEAGLRIVNVTHPQPVSLDDLVTAYRTHLLPELQWQDDPAPAGIPPEVVLSSDALQRFVTLPHYDAPADAFARQVAEFNGL